MLHVYYDGTFDGFLSVIFQSYVQQFIPDQLSVAGESSQNLFEEELQIRTSEEEAGRVWKGLCRKLPSRYRNFPLNIYLSEAEDSALRLYHFIRYCFSCRQTASYHHPDFTDLVKLDRKVKNEAERVRQFVRFQLLKNGIYFSAIEPCCNVLPLTIGYFKDRFADQPWIIYDTRRNYGLYYDLETVQSTLLSQLRVDLQQGLLPAEVLEENELDFQQLWKNYFDKICIEERRNPRLQRSQMPVRFWKYLPEKALNSKADSLNSPLL